MKKPLFTWQDILFGVFVVLGILICKLDSYVTTPQYPNDTLALQASKAELQKKIFLDNNHNIQDHMLKITLEGEQHIVDNKHWTAYQNSKTSWLSTLGLILMMLPFGVYLIQLLIKRD